MATIRASHPEDGERAVAIWRAAVEATHDFLLPEDREALDILVSGLLPGASLWLAVDDGDRVLGFMLLEGSHIEALFVDPAVQGTGIGGALVRHAITLHGTVTTDVNEQNGQAAGFYARLGFRRTGRSPLDGQSRPYPLIHLSFQPEAGG